MTSSLSEPVLSPGRFRRKRLHQAALKLLGTRWEERDERARVPQPEPRASPGASVDGWLLRLGANDLKRAPGKAGALLATARRGAWRVQAGVQLTGWVLPSAVIAPGRKAQ